MKKIIMMLLLFSRSQVQLGNENANRSCNVKFLNFNDKIASFENLKNNVVYDSRVIYSLNWLIYKYNKFNDEQEKYLFQPEGRNKALTFLPVNSIISFENSKKINLSKRGDNIYRDIFINKNECYKHLVELIKMINKSLFKNMQINIPFYAEVVNMEEYPFFTEMLLFKMADKEIFSDVKKSISVNIKKEQSN